MPLSSRRLPTFSSIRFRVPGFMLRSLIHLELNFVQDDRYGTMWIFVHAAIQFDKHRLLEMLSSLPVFISGFFIKKQVSIDPYVG